MQKSICDKCNLTTGPHHVKVKKKLTDLQI